MPVLGTTRTAREWPTWVALAVCYTIWLSAITWHDVLGWFWVAPAMLMATFHSSLQHEALHGHPTRSGALNEILVFPAIGLFVPYRRFRDTHLRHHNNVMLTDPYDDPESWYLSRHDWHHTSPLMRGLLNINSTLGGRILVGPALALYGFWRNDLKLVRAGDRQVLRAYIMHFTGVVPIIALLVWLDIPLWTYGLFVAYPGMSILMIRTFIEHRAEKPVAERTAVIEAGLLMRLLFLNNNYHAVHHSHPCPGPGCRISGASTGQRSCATMAATTIPAVIFRSPGAGSCAAANRLSIPSCAVILMTPTNGPFSRKTPALNVKRLFPAFRRKLSAEAQSRD